MKKKYILILLIVLIFSLSTYIASYSNLKSVVQVSNMNDNAGSDSATVKTVNEETKNYKIQVYFPYTKYSVLNDEISKYVDKTIADFKNDSTDLNNKFKLSLIIKFDTYQYKNYTSYVFHTMVDLAGAHPNTYIKTITYDTSKNEIVDIDKLMERNKDILKIMSKESYDTLIKEEKIKNTLDTGMLKDGTKIDKNNFKNFAFDKNGLKIFFEKYQVAPYYVGESTVLIPYEKLNVF